MSHSSGDVLSNVVQNQLLQWSHLTFWIEASEEINTISTLYLQLHKSSSIHGPSNTDKFLTEVAAGVLRFKLCCIFSG